MSKEIMWLIGSIFVIGSFVAGVSYGENSDSYCPEYTAQTIITSNTSPECQCPDCSKQVCNDEMRKLYLEEATKDTHDNKGSDDDNTQKPRTAIPLVRTGGMFSADEVLKGLNSSNIHLQNTACHYVDNYPDDRYIEPLLKIMHSSDITKPLPPEHEWGEDYLASACMNGLVSLWYLKGTSKKAWNETLNYFKTVKLDELPFNYNGYGIFSYITRPISKAEDGWKEKATYYNPDILTEAIIMFVHNIFKELELSNIEDQSQIQFKIGSDALRTITTHSPKYIKYLAVDPVIPEMVRSYVINRYSALMQSSNTSEDVLDDACIFWSKVKSGKKLKDPVAKRLGLPDQFTDTSTFNTLFKKANELKADCISAEDIEDIVDSKDKEMDSPRRRSKTKKPKVDNSSNQNSRKPEGKRQSKTTRIKDISIELPF